MVNKTAGVRDLVREALEQIQRPYTEDVTLEVCRVIDKDASFSLMYRQLENELSHDVVNNWIGRYTRDLTGTQSAGKVVVTGPLIKSYQKLRPRTLKQGG
jgi:hypothetical protein